jgi:hypothetical protein
MVLNKQPELIYIAIKRWENVNMIPGNAADDTAILALYKWNFGRLSIGEARYSSPSITITGASLVKFNHGFKTGQLRTYQVIKIFTGVLQAHAISLLVMVVLPWLPPITTLSLSLRLFVNIFRVRVDLQAQFLRF